MKTKMSLVKNSLVLYKNRPARIVRIDDKLEIELERGESIKVRPKDVTLLHAGPIQSLNELEPPAGEIQIAWELLSGGQTTLRELAELAYGDYTPATAWAAWQLVSDGLYFRGDADNVIACTPEQVAQTQTARQAEAAEKLAWEAFLDRAHRGRIAPEDAVYLQEVEKLALKQSAKSRVMRELGREEKMENAHALLLELGYWDETFNPYPQRFGLATVSPIIELPPLPHETRTDLTHLPAFAIDDEDTQTPDDALSLEGDRLWVHIADAAVLLAPDSPADLEARTRGATLHLPEAIAHMLPTNAIRQLGLGLTEISPALSFGLDIDPGGNIVHIEILPSWIKVTRLTYDEAETQLETEPFKRLYALAQIHQERRRANGAIFIELPEVKIRVQDNQINLRLLPSLKSRALVREAMIMAGEAAARFALDKDISVPFATQEPIPMREQPQTFSEMIALRHDLQRSQYRNTPTPHGGVGLPAYAQATSPLRRYLDLVVHQQLRAYLRGDPILDSQAILERIGATESVLGSVRQVEWLSARHWTLAYLLRQPDWRGEGIVVEKRDPPAASGHHHTTSGRLLIPELGMEIQTRLPADLPLDSSVTLFVRGIDLAYLDAHFGIEA